MWESHESTGEVSLKELFDNKEYDIDGKSSRMTIEELIFAASRGGCYALVECKLGSAEIDEGAEHLLELKRLITEHNLHEKLVPIRQPDLLIVLTGGTMAYTRPDGVKVIPLASLKN